MAAASQYSQGEKLALGGAGLTAVAAFLPWVKVSLGSLASASQNGIDGDGTITLVLALVAIALVVLRDWEKVDKGAVLVAGLLTTAIGGMYIADPASGMDMSGAAQQYVSASPQIGLFLTAIGGLGMLGGGAIGLSN